MKLVVNWGSHGEGLLTGQREGKLRAVDMFAKWELGFVGENELFRGKSDWSQKDKKGEGMASITREVDQTGPILTRWWATRIFEMV